MWIVSLRFENAEGRGRRKETRENERKRKRKEERDVKNTVKGRGLNFRGRSGLMIYAFKLRLRLGSSPIFYDAFRNNYKI